jgi:hypothetical protein
MKLIRKENSDYYLLVNGEIKSLQEFNTTKEDCDILTLGYSVEKMAQSAFTHPDFGEYKVGSIAYYNGYKDGFNAHKELVKDNFILSEDDLHRILNMARLQGEESFLVKHTNEEIIQSLLPKTEWDIEITPEGKIVLL